MFPCQLYDSIIKMFHINSPPPPQEIFPISYPQSHTGQIATTLSIVKILGRMKIDVVSVPKSHLRLFRSVRRFFCDFCSFYRVGIRYPKIPEKRNFFLQSKRLFGSRLSGLFFCPLREIMPEVAPLLARIGGGIKFKR